MKTRIAFLEFCYTLLFVNKRRGVNHNLLSSAFEPWELYPSRSRISLFSTSHIFHDLSAKVDRAPPRNMQPTNIFADRYPDVEASCSAIGSANTVGSTNGKTIIPNAEGRRCIPTTSAVTGTTVPQNIPVTVPLARANARSTAYVFAGTHIVKQKTPHRAVMASSVSVRPAIVGQSLRCIPVAISILPKLSDSKPITGRPKASPRFNTAPTIEPCLADSPIELA